MSAPPVAGVLLDGRYRVGSVVARGGMSTVHRGHDTRLDRPVAVKVMDESMAGDPAFRMRFEREARSAARIDHPAVVDVYDQGADAGRLFLVMELVDGGTLRDLLRARGPLGVPVAVAVMERVLAGLAQAHRLGLVHRDVKPENVLISSSGEAKVADFGLAVAAAEAGASHVGMIMGTVAYLSPEQVASGTADSRSDVYAAGVLLYELLTGAPPYSGETAISVAYRHVNSDVPPPSLIATEVPPELDALVVAATRRDPAARPADAGAMLDRLRQVATLLEVPRVPIPAPPPRPLEEQATIPHAVPPPGPGGTRLFDRPDDTPEPAAGPPGHHRARRRSRRVFAIWIAAVLLLALGIGLSAWWLGAGRWTAMPRLQGAQQDVAEQLLTEADLVARPTSVYDDSVALGIVTSADPEPGTRLLRGTAVQIVVSKGRPTVPAIGAGTPVADAEAAIRAAQLNPVTTDDGTDYSDTAPAGTVLRTEPAAGATVPLGGTVTLVVSAGEQPEQVRVPQLKFKSYAEAQEILEGLGLKAEENPRLGALGRTGGTVFDQSAGAGSLVDPGTTITLETL